MLAEQEEPPMELILFGTASHLLAVAVVLVGHQAPMLLVKMVVQAAVVHIKMELAVQEIHRL